MRRGPTRSSIGEVAAPPFVRLPDPIRLFVDRAERLRALAAGHELGPYLRFLADLAELQYRIQDGLPEPDMPDARALRARPRHSACRRSTAAASPPTRRSRRRSTRCSPLRPRSTCRAAARAALARVRAAGREARDAMLRDGAGRLPSRSRRWPSMSSSRRRCRSISPALAARLDAKAPGAGRRRRLPGLRRPAGRHRWWSAGTARTAARFCACALCGTLWNYVRIKCTLCGSTKGIGYQEVEGGAGTVKAETCDNCRGYVKILHQHKDPDARYRSPTTWRASASICWCARPAIGAARSTRFCSAIEACDRRACRSRLRKLPSVDKVLQDAARRGGAIERFGRHATIECRRARALARRARCRARGSRSPTPRRSLRRRAGAARGRRSRHQPAPGLQPDRHRAAHQSRPRASRRGGDRGRVAAMRSAVALEFDLGSGRRGERDDHLRALALRADRRRGRDRRQQQRRRRAARAQHAGAAAARRSSRAAS